MQAAAEHTDVRAQRMAALGQLAGGVAHDFNNLLTVIIGYGDMLASGVADEQTRRAAEVILDAANRAAMLTNQLLMFSRQQEASPRPVNVAEALGSIERMLRRLIPEDVMLVVTVSDPSAVTEIDPGQLDQVFVNLSVNARDAMPHGGRLGIDVGRAHVRDHVDATGERVPAGDYVVIAISDTGTGMSEETRSRLFEPFFTTKPEGEGTGLGLATVYGIVKRFGGFLDVESTLGVGTTVAVFLPAVTSEQAPHVGHESPAIAGGEETILLAEDDHVVRTLVLRTLQKAGYQVLAVADGAEALALSATYPGPIHLVLSDLVMPQMSGPQLLGALRETRPSLRALMMTAHTDHPEVQAHLDLESEAVLRKPFKPATLLTTVRRRLDEERGSA